MMHVLPQCKRSWYDAEGGIRNAQIVGDPLGPKPKVQEGLLRKDTPQILSPCS